jgi:hypothetical protein
MPLAKRKQLANIMGALSEDEEEKSPDAKVARVTSPKVVVSVGEASGGNGGAEVEALKDGEVFEDDRIARMAHTVGSGNTLATATSEERPLERSFDERGEFLGCVYCRGFLFVILVDPLQLLQHRC